MIEHLPDADDEPREAAGQGILAALKLSEADKVEYATGMSDTVIKVPGPMRRLMKANARALDHLPGKLPVHLPPDPAKIEATEERMPRPGSDELHPSSILPNGNDSPL